MQMSEKQFKIATIIVVVLFIGLAIYALVASPKNQDNESTKTTVDQTSGQSVTTIEGQNENYGVDENMPIFIGTSRLVSEAGMSFDQTNAFKNALYEYIIAKQLNTKQVSIDKAPLDVVIPNSESTDPVTVSFKFVLDEKTNMQATIVYYLPSDFQLTLKDSSGKEIYNTGMLKTYNFNT